MCSNTTNLDKLTEINKFLKEIDITKIAKQDEKAFSCLLKLTHASFQLVALQNSSNSSSRSKLQKNNQKELIFFYRKNINDAKKIKSFSNTQIKEHLETILNCYQKLLNVIH